MSPKGPTATAALQNWLASLNKGNTPTGGRTAMVNSLAFDYRNTIQDLLDDLAVQEAIDRAYERPSNEVSRSKRLDLLKSLLVDVCWLENLKILNQQAGKNAAGSPSFSRTTAIRRLKASARKASSLAEELTALSPVIGKLKAASYMQQIEVGDRQQSTVENRSWRSAVPIKGPSISELLLTLAAGLDIRAATLKESISRTRQRSGGKHDLYALIDPLCQLSAELGNLNADGTSCPDYDLVHALVTSLLPNQSLDVSTLRKRWSLKGKPKHKSP